MPKPETVNQSFNVDVDIPSERFWVRSENGDDAQVRLEPDGSVYLCYTANNRRTIESREMSWPDFVAAFRQFVEALPAIDEAG